MSNLFFYIIKKINKNEELLPHLKVFKKPNKYETLQFYIINGFLKKEDKEIISELFFKAQKIYFAFVKFSFLYRFKKASLFEMKQDLFYNSFDKFPISQKITILHENKRYIFRLTDLIQCWKKALTHNEDLFPVVQNLKNPYTNLPFKNYNLYNIYYRIYFSSFQIPFLIQEFFNLNFNKNHFLTKFSIILKDIAIINYVDTAYIQELCDDIQTMFNLYYIGEKNLDFYLNMWRTKEIIKILKDYIYLFI